MTAPVIYRLNIEHFRGIRSLSWFPNKGVNIILGGGDVGKTTILEALALLLSPTNTTILSESDYYARDMEAGFIIEAIIALPPDSGINNEIKPSFPWQWDGNDAVVPNMEDDDATTGQPVYRIRVRGTEHHELTYEIVQPNNSEDVFRVALRRAIGLVRLSGDDRNDRDLRLVQGSALDRLLSDKGLRSRLASSLAKDGAKDELLPEARKALNALDEAFKTESLPSQLDLAITGSQGISIAALIGLTADRQGIHLPLASWGAGTRRVAALVIAEQNQGQAPITLVDEIERGLEPYRQRLLIAKLQRRKSQTFVTTHSPFVISAATEASLWYVDHEGKIGLIDSSKTEKHRKTDPEAFLSRLTVVAEGAAEKGFVTGLLEKTLGSSLEQYGVHVSDGAGHESTLRLLQALGEGGLRFGGFADNEGGKYPDLWKKIEANLGKLLFRWTSGCLEENIISAVPENKLDALLTDPEDEKTGTRLRTLATRLDEENKELVNIKKVAGTNFRTLILEAALGMVPPGKEQEKEYKRHGQDWFKTISGGRELLQKMFTLGAWPELKPQLLPFCNAVRKSVGLSEIQDLVP
jgi:putative ATP-dependent endonuclease of the OLD family